MWLGPRRCYKRGSEWGKNGHNVAKLPSKITKNRRRGGGNGVYNIEIVIARRTSVRRGNLNKYTSSPDLRSKAMGIYLCFRSKKLKFLFSTFCRQKVESKPRGDKFSGSQLAVSKMVAFALLRVKRSPFLNPPPALCPFSEISSAAFLLSPTE